MIKIIKIGDKEIGENKDILVQSMTNTKTYDYEKTMFQVNELVNNGCDIVRVSVPDFESIQSLKKITDNCIVPIVADIHFNYKIAIESIKSGVAKIRLNPGNIESEWQLKEIIKVANEYNVAIRVGSNSGSLNKNFLNEKAYIALAESALNQVHQLEKNGFFNIVISAKSSSINDNYLANKYIRNKVNYPLHWGITEAGLGEKGIIKSSIGLGLLLNENIGETIRVSLSDDPINEVRVGIEILKALHIRHGVDIISCPTCSRTEINVSEFAKKIELWTKEYDKMNKNIKIAVMGCVVNGIGEGKNANIGIAGLTNGAVIFKNGEKIKTVKSNEIENELKIQIGEYIKEDL